MFVVAGRILAAEGSSRTADVTALLARRPDLARPLLAGTAALLGFPPFVLFFTEVAIIVTGWQAGLGWAMGIALALLLVVFAGLARHVSAMALGEPTEPGAVDRASEVTAMAADHSTMPPAAPFQPAAPGRQAPLLLALGAAAVLGFLAIPLAALLGEAAAVLAGGR
jgi:hydrogenase-4 component F